MHFLLVTGVSPQYGKNCSFRSIIISSKSIFWENMPRHFYAEFYKLLGCHVSLFMILCVSFVMTIKLNKLKIKLKKLHNSIKFA